MQDGTRRTLAVTIIVVGILALLPETVAAVRYVAFGISRGDWLNDWATHGWIAGLFAAVSDVLTGRMGIDYPWENTLPECIADAMYWFTGLLKGAH